MNVLVGCEYSGTVGFEFLKRGHNVWTCDLLPSECEEVPHFQGDIFECITESLYTDYIWDLIILHPPCTHMAVCGNRWWAGTQERYQALQWTWALWGIAKLHAKRVALENPVGVLGSAIGPAAQYVQPWQFGHPETKKTGLWLHNLPPLEPTDNVYDHMMTLPTKERHRIWYTSPSEDRGKERSRFYTGIAQAMAEQWGGLDDDEVF